MDKRAQLMEKLCAVQRQLHRIAEWKLSEIDERLASIEESRREVLAALDRDQALQSLFLATSARRLVALARKGEDVGREQEAQRAALLEQASRLKTAERISADLSEARRRAEERRLLLDLIEAHLDVRAKASLKFGGA
jgi:hypothetical protein